MHIIHLRYIENFAVGSGHLNLAKFQSGTQIWQQRQRGTSRFTWHKTQNHPLLPYISEWGFIYSQCQLCELNQALSISVLLNP